MTAVVEVGPVGVRGPNMPPQEHVSVAMDCIDDDYGLLDGQLVEVSQLWRDIVAAALGEFEERLTLVVPTWWPAARVAVVTRAVDDCSSRVVVLQRATMLSADADMAVVEFAEDLVVVAPAGCEPQVLDRERSDIAVHVGAAAVVLLDVPAGVTPPAASVTAALRASGVGVVRGNRHRVVAAAAAALPDEERPVQHGRRRTRVSRRSTAVLTGAALTAAAVGGGWMAQTPTRSVGVPPDTALLVEGHVSVRVPAHWAVERITSGPGSARVRITQPGGGAALHITQSTAAAPVTLAEAAETLRRAIESTPAGVFVDFRPDDHIGGRPAVTYRERRTDAETSWTVVVDGATRIAVGCQYPADHPDAVRAACEQAVRSARAVR